MRRLLHIASLTGFCCFFMSACMSPEKFATVNDSTYFNFSLATEKVPRTENEILFVIDDSLSMVEEIARLRAGLEQLVANLANPTDREPLKYTLHMIRLSDFQPQNYSRGVALISDGRVYSGLAGGSSIENFLDGLTLSSIEQAGIEIEPGIAASYKAIRTIKKMEVKAFVAFLKSRWDSESEFPQNLTDILEGRFTLQESLELYPDDTLLQNIAEKAEDKSTLSNLYVLLLSDEDNSARVGDRTVYLEEPRQTKEEAAPEREITGYQYKFKRPISYKKIYQTSEVCAYSDRHPSTRYNSYSYRYSCRDSLNRHHYFSSSNQTNRYMYCRRPKTYTCQKSIDGIPRPYETTKSLSSLTSDCVPHPLAAADPANYTTFEKTTQSYQSFPGVSECAVYTCTVNWDNLFYMADNKLRKRTCAEGDQESTTWRNVGSWFSDAADLNEPPLGARISRSVDKYEYASKQWLTKISNSQALGNFRATQPADTATQWSNHGNPTTLYAQIQDPQEPQQQEEIEEHLLDILKAKEIFYPDLRLVFNAYVSHTDGKCDSKDKYDNKEGRQYIELSDRTNGISGDICKLEFDNFIKQVSAKLFDTDQKAIMLPERIDLEKGSLVVRLGSGQVLTMGADYTVEAGEFLVFAHGVLSPGEHVKVSFAPLRRTAPPTRPSLSR